MTLSTHVRLSLALVTALVACAGLPAGAGADLPGEPGLVVTYVHGPRGGCQLPCVFHAVDNAAGPIVSRDWICRYLSMTVPHIDIAEPPADGTQMSCVATRPGTWGIDLTRRFADGHTSFGSYDLDVLNPKPFPARPGGFVWQAPVYPDAEGKGGFDVDANLSFFPGGTVRASGRVWLQALDDARWHTIAEATLAPRTVRGHLRIALGAPLNLPDATLCAQRGVRAEGRFSVTAARRHSILPAADRRTLSTDITAAVHEACTQNVRG